MVQPKSRGRSMHNEGASDLAVRPALIQVSAQGAAPTDLERIIAGNPKAASDQERAISVSLPAIVSQTPQCRAVNGCP